MRKIITKDEEIYSWEEIHKILGKINNDIELFRNKYHMDPNLIIISERLEYILKSQFDLMSHNEMIILNDKPLKINRVFSLSCLTSPALSNLNFEIR